MNNSNNNNNNNYILPCLNSIIKDINININNTHNQIFIESLIRFSNIINNNSIIDYNLVLNIILNYFKTDFYKNNPFYFDGFIQFIKDNSDNNSNSYIQFLKSILVLNLPSNFQYYFLDRLIEYIKDNGLLEKDFSLLLEEILSKNRNDKVVLNKLANFGKFINGDSSSDSFSINNKERINLITSKENLDKFTQGIDRLFSLDYLNDEKDYLNLIDCIQDHPSYNEMHSFLNSNFDKSLVEYLNLDFEVLAQYYQHYGSGRVSGIVESCNDNDSGGFISSNKFLFYLKCLNIYKSNHKIINK